MSYNSLSQHFSTYFNLVVADSPDLLEEVFRIRYQVYCEELQYEPIDKFPDGMERDIYDERSIHCLLQHKPSGVFAGCVRLILADRTNPLSTFPFENICSQNLSIDFNKQSRTQFCEVSRLAVRGEFRKRSGEKQVPEGLLLDDRQLEELEQNKRRFPLIALSLYLFCTSVMVEFGLDTFTLMEPRLARHLYRYGFPSIPISSIVNYHGRRGAFLITRTGILDHLNGDAQSLFEMIQKQVSLSLPNHSLTTQMSTMSLTL